MPNENFGAAVSPAWAFAGFPKLVKLPGLGLLKLENADLGGSVDGVVVVLLAVVVGVVVGVAEVVLAKGLGAPNEIPVFGAPKLI